MYKEIIISVIIIILILGVNGITQAHTKNATDNLDTELTDLRKIMLEENKEEAQKQIDTIFEHWKEEYKKLTFYIEHDELEKVETELTLLRANIETEEYAQGIANLDNGIFILNHIKNKFTLDIKNIF